MYDKYLALMPIMVGIFVSDTYLAITCAVVVVVGCVLVNIFEMLGLYAHVACRLYELYLEFGSHICLVIYVNYVDGAPC